VVRKRRKEGNTLELVTGVKMPKIMPLLVSLRKNGFKVYKSDSYIIVEIDDSADIEKLSKLLRQYLNNLF
jgi:hypothetical protein